VPENEPLKNVRDVEGVVVTDGLRNEVGVPDTQALGVKLEVKVCRLDTVGESVSLRVEEDVWESWDVAHNSLGLKSCKAPAFSDEARKGWVHLVSGCPACATLHSSGTSKRSPAAAVPSIAFMASGAPPDSPKSPAAAASAPSIFVGGPAQRSFRAPASVSPAGALGYSYGSLSLDKRLFKASLFDMYAGGCSEVEAAQVAAQVTPQTKAP
jgi:hypothetical protein